MNPTAPAAAIARAERMAGYLREDPRNPALLADACDAALSAGLHALAAQHLDTAEALALDRADWLFRRARLCIAQRRLDDAAGLLLQLQALAGPHPAIAHDLAHVRMLQGAHEACRELLAPWLADDGQALEPSTLEALQVLWLRASHHAGLHDTAWQWALAQLAASRLQPAACGVASLVAFDLARFDGARSLADAALAQRPAQVEALVTRATLALADRDTGRAAQWLEQALACNPDDGRTWSALGLCSLQAGDWPTAQLRFERALRTLPTHIGTWHVLAWSRLLQQDAEGALAAFQQALALDPAFGESQGGVGLGLVLTGQRDQAQAYLERARRLDAANFNGGYARALLAGEVNDRAGMLAMVDRLLDRPGFGSRKLSEEVRAGVGVQ